MPRRRRASTLPRAEALVAIGIRISPSLDQKRRQLEELLDLSAPELYARGVGLVEAEIEGSKTTARPAGKTAP